MNDHMGMSRTILVIGLYALFLLFAVRVVGQTTNTYTRNDLVGVWGMFKDKHPDGWGSHNPPYEYLEFTQDNKYFRTYLHKKGNGIIIGTYELVHDSLLVFHESTGFDGTHTGPVKADTARLYSLRSDLMELWEDWDRIFWKSSKKWGHKKKYRPLTIQEKENLQAVTTKLMNEYARLKETEENDNE